MKTKSLTGIISLVLFLVLLSGTQTQSFAQSINEDDYIKMAEEMPEVIGGLEAIQKLVVYPEEAKKNKIEGKVFVQAFIDEKGNVVKVEVLKGVSELNEAAMKAVKETKFTPAKMKGKAVKSQVTAPIFFKLQ